MKAFPSFILTIVMLSGLFAIGCSKHSSPKSEAAKRQRAAEMAALERSQVVTNSLDVLQARFQEDEKQIEAAQTKLDALRRKYGITDRSRTQLDQTNQNGEVIVTSQQTYWDAKRKLAEMVEFHKVLQAKIQADKMDAQIPSQGTH